MRQPILLSTLLFISSFSASAEPAVQCTLHAPGPDGKGLLAPVEIDYDRGVVRIQGRAEEKIRARDAAPIPGIAEFLAASEACNALPEKGVEEGGRLKCHSAAMDAMMAKTRGESSLIVMARLGVVFLQISRDAPESETLGRADFDLARIASARAFQLGEASKFGIPGLFEYADSSGALLGRFLIATPFVMPCK